jgi:cytoskeletal protein CcmA (bactofilin family)
MSKHALRGLAVILTFMIVMMLTAVPVSAFDARSGDTVTVGSREVVDDDLYVGAATVVIDGVVNGELWAAGYTITVNGAVDGSVMAAAYMIDISGDIGHAVRVAGQTISISGNVNGDLMAFGAVVNVASTATVKGDLLVGAEDVRLDGLIEGDIKGGGSEVTIGNGVKGNVELEVDSLTILSTANIEGDLTYTSEEEADIQSGAQIGGATTHNLPPVKEEPAKPAPLAPFPSILGWVIGFLMALVTGIVIILTAPNRLTSVAESIRTRPGASAAWGALVVFITPIAAILVCITIVGIPLGLIALALWGIGLYLAQIPVGLLIGRLIIRRFRGMERRGILIAALALGLVILKLLELLLGLIPVPLLGFFIWLVIVALFGLGAVVVSERRRRAAGREAASS